MSIQQKGVSAPISAYVPSAPMPSSMPVVKQTTVPPAPMPSTMPVAKQTTVPPAPMPSTVPVAKQTTAPPAPMPSTVPVAKQTTVAPKPMPSPMPVATTKQTLPPTPVASPPPVKTNLPAAPTPVATPTPAANGLLGRVNDFVQNKLSQMTGGLSDLMSLLGTLSPEELAEALKRPEVQAKLQALLQDAINKLMSSVLSPEEMAAIKNYLDIARQLAGSNGYLGAEDIDKIARATSDPGFMAAMLRTGLFNDELVRPGIQGTRRGDRRGDRRANGLANRLTRRPNGLISRIGGRIVYNMTRSELSAVLQQMGVNLSNNFPNDNTMLQLDPQQIAQALQQQALMTQLEARLKAQLQAIIDQLKALGIDLSKLNIKISFPNGIPIPPSAQSVLDAALNGKPAPAPLNSPGQLLNDVKIDISLKP